VKTGLDAMRLTTAPGSDLIKLECTSPACNFVMYFAPFAARLDKVSETAIKHLEGGPVYSIQHDPQDATVGASTPARTGWVRATACGTGTCVEVMKIDGGVLMRDSKHPERLPLMFTTAEWDAFVAGVQAGEFDSGASL
jgi:hypothetical protein